MQRSKDNFFIRLFLINTDLFDSKFMPAKIHFCFTLSMGKTHFLIFDVFRFL